MRTCEPSLRARLAETALLKEEPDVAAVPGTRPLQGSRQGEPAACVEESAGVFLPVLLVEIGRQEMTRLVLKHRINAHDEIPALTISSGKMPSNDFIGDWNKTPVWAIGTPDSRLLTDASNPFVCASWRITGLSSSLALEPDGKNIRSPAKQRPEQLYLSLGRRILGDQSAVLIQSPNLLPYSTFGNGNVNGRTATVGTKPPAVYFVAASECGKKRRVTSFAVVKVSDLIFLYRSFRAPFCRSF